MSKPLNTNFHIKAPKPIDDRMMVNAFVDLDAIPVKYNHMVVHVESTDEDWKYYLNINTWVDVTLNGPTVWGEIIGTIANQTDLMAEFAKYALAGHTHPPQAYAHTHPESDITNLDKYTQAEVDALIRYQTAFSTGDLFQGLVTITAGDDTTFDLAAGIGIKAIWSSTDPFAPPVTYPVEYSEVLAVTPTYLATHPATYIGLDYDEVGDSVTIVQSSSPFSNTARRSIIAKATIEHANNTNITSITNEVNPSATLGESFQDLSRAIGMLNMSGNVYGSNGANLSINKSAGILHRLGTSYNIPLDNSTKITALQTALTFRYRLQNSTEYADTTTVDPANYDNANVLTAVPADKWTIQRLYIMSSGETRAQYGQVVYDTYSDALYALEYDPYVTDLQLLNDGIFRGYLVVVNTATDLSDTLHGDFIEVDKWGWARKPKNSNIIESTADLINNGEDGDNPFITLLDLYRDNKLINGDYYNIPNTYEFFVWADNYILANINYTTYISNTVTLAAASVTPGQDRIDVIVINTNQTITVVSGVTSGTPEKPSIDDDTQLEVGFVLVSSATTAPADVINTAAYNENLQEVGGEWDTSLVGSASVTEIIDPSDGTLHGSFSLAGDRITLTNSVSMTPVEFDKIIFKIKLVSGANQGYYLRFYDTGSPSQWRVPVNHGDFGFDATNFSTYQTIIVSSNWISRSSFNNVQFHQRQAGVSYIDEVLFQKGTPIDNGNVIIPGLQEVTDKDPNTTNPMFMDVTNTVIDDSTNGKIVVNRDWVLANTTPTIANTLIKGLGASVTTAAALGSFLLTLDGLSNLTDVEIPHFLVNGNDIECFISVPYIFEVSAFSSNTDIISYEDLGDLVKTVSVSTFAGCTNITLIRLQAVLRIDSNAFDSCSSITTLYFPHCESVLGNPFNNMTSLTSLKIPSLRKLTDCNNFFVGCASLTNIEEEDFFHLREIQGNSLGGSLVSVNFPNVEIIGLAIFKNISTLTTCILPNVKTLGQQVFWGSGVTSLDLPELKEVIDTGLNTFRASSLTLLNIPKCIVFGSTTGNNGVFDSINSGCVINAHSSMKTIDGGAMEGDLLYAQNTRSCIITFVRDKISQFNNDSGYRTKNTISQTRNWRAGWANVDNYYRSRNDAWAYSGSNSSIWTDTTLTTWAAMTSAHKVAGMPFVFTPWAAKAVKIIIRIGQKTGAADGLKVIAYAIDPSLGVASGEILLNESTNALTVSDNDAITITPNTTTIPEGYMICFMFGITTNAVTEINMAVQIDLEEV